MCGATGLRAHFRMYKDNHSIDFNYIYDRVPLRVEQQFRWV